MRERETSYEAAFPTVIICQLPSSDFPIVKYFLAFGTVMGILIQISYENHPQ